MKKAQVSIEFLVILGIVFFIFLLLMVFFLDIRIDLRKLEGISKVKSDCSKLSNTISQVIALGEGSSARIKLEHNITIQNQTIFISYDKSNLICSYLGKVSNDVNLNIGNLLLTNVNNSVVMKNE